MGYFTINPNYLLSLCLFLSLTNLAYAQNNGIYVIDAASKVPVQDAFVQSTDLNFNATADENGFVSLVKLQGRVNKLFISCIGYESQNIEPGTFTLTNSPIIYLEPKVSGLKEINISASANSGVFKTISDLDIHLRPINNSQEVLRIVPGLFIGQHAGGGKSEQMIPGSLKVFVLKLCFGRRGVHFYKSDQEAIRAG